jgi:hypothetical protein
MEAPAFLYKFIISILLLGSVIGCLIYWKKSRSVKILKVAATTVDTSAELISPYDGMDIFDAVEQALLHLLISNVKEFGKRTATEEVNRVLGVALKS